MGTELVRKEPLTESMLREMQKDYEDGSDWMIGHFQCEPLDGWIFAYPLHALGHELERGIWFPTNRHDESEGVEISPEEAHSLAQTVRTKAHHELRLGVRDGSEWFAGIGADHVSHWLSAPEALVVADALDAAGHHVVYGPPGDSHVERVFSVSDAEKFGSGDVEVTDRGDGLMVRFYLREDLSIRLNKHGDDEFYVEAVEFQGGELTLNPDEFYQKLTQYPWPEDWEDILHRAVFEFRKVHGYDAGRP